jgi:hypothetical protein
MKGYLKAVAYELCHCEERIGVSLNQSFGIMSGCLKSFARKLTDCHAMLAMTKPKGFPKPSLPSKTCQLSFIVFQAESLYFCLYHSVNHKINEI